MGMPMGERLLESQHQLVVFNRTRRKAEPLLDLGATWARDPQEAVQLSELTILMLTDATAIRETMEVRGRFPDLTGRHLCQMGTIAPRESIALMEDIHRSGGEYFEAPVLGSRPQARAGRLLVMVGARETQFQKWREALSALGENPLLVGVVGQAAAMKLAFNQLIAAELTGFATALGLVRHHDLETEDFMKLLRQSALFAPTFDAKLPRFVSGDFEKPNFPARLLLKDLLLAKEVAAESGLHVAALDGLCSLIRDAVDQGRGDDDYSVLASVVDPERT
jgi:3-hydroxyisobutyrate dehydrogenase-like beta-hydroxyacid dehydrogenase